jgi:hypothetical protein
VDAGSLSPQRSANRDRRAFEDLSHAVLTPFAGPGSLRLDDTGPRVELKRRPSCRWASSCRSWRPTPPSGAWSNEHGRVSLSWELDDTAGNTLRIEWRESGGPPAEPPDRPGFGLNFIVRCSEYELRGTCVRAYPPE